MPISSSRQRLMPESPDKLTVRSQPNLTKKHHGKLHQEEDKISLPRINKLQIDEQEKELSLSQQRTFSSPYGKTDCMKPGKEPTGKKKQDRDRLKDIAFRKIRVFNKIPELEPLTLVFTSQDDVITHNDVLDGLKRVRDISVDDVSSIQFIDMNVVLGSAGVPGRWLIRVKGRVACRVLLEAGLTVKDERICLRRYDDVNAEDYNAYMKRKALLTSDEHNEIQKLLSTNTNLN